MSRLTIDTAFVEAARAGSVQAFASFEQSDLEVSRMFTSDLCYAVAVLAGRTIRLVLTAKESGDELEHLVVPAICQKCVLEGLAGIVKRAIGSCPALEWVDGWPDTPEDACADCKSESDEPDDTKVGIIGTAPLIFEPFLNDHIAKLIESLGYTLIYPRPESLFTDDVRYEDELARFVKLGVRKVIYLQSFGCLKGHVHARGALHGLAKKFPELHITVLDYDAEASSLNRENRIRLALGLR
ncbi:MAG: hypothetical protein Q4D34_03740 [Eggerthellaceae bacterium]|nr:hypothetical protein [Eggerthellaceae bacterium]